MSEKDRAHPRASLQVVSLARIHQGGSEDNFENVLVVDISESGAQLKFSDPLPRLRNLEIFWVPVVGLEPLILLADCVWSRNSACGVRFKNLDPRALAVLKSFVKFHRD